ncbi:phage terminase large subunit [Halomonas sp. SL1]|uniref:phage terminase large subunit n=1 Tax=Halomonas sp. SL1 TaxID=2137478 RepID=UPI000D16E308|nr:phage terminase large subunit [Halomonas sp. SL1]RAH36731.1 hypothetical protein C9J49_014340 [Halomonas sp. SL1]
MAAPRKTERNFTFHISQEDLENEIEILAPLSKKQEIYINDDEHDILLFGGASGAGKSFLSLLKLLIDCVEDPNYNSFLLRESLVQIKSPGSLWEEANKMFAQFGAKSNNIQNQIRFPNGAFIKFHYLKDNENDFQGSQANFLIDEASQIKNVDNVWYLTSRMRGRSKKRKTLRMTANPDRNSFLFGWLNKAGYLDEMGYPEKSMDGVTTYLVQLQGDFEFFLSRKAIKDKYGDAAAKSAYSFVFHSANIYNNPIYLKDQPEYVFKLENLKKLEKDRLLHGNWLVSDNPAGFIKREDFKEIDLCEVPLDIPIVRSWDLAATPVDPTKGKKNGGDPDWTRGTLCGYEKDTGNFYILDMKSLRDRSALVDNLVMKTAREDSKYDAYTIIPQDVGASGVEVAQTKRTKLLAQGSKPIIHKARKAKLKMAENFLIAVQEGRVFVVKGTFSDANYSELENFLGDNKNNGHHDDVMDTLAQAYSILTTGRLIPTIKLDKNNPRLKNLFGKTLLS